MKPLANLIMLARVLAGRMDIAMCSVGIAEATHAAVLGWMKNRKMGGALLSSYQGLQWM
jgi:alkylation response protein AidB-like acyl-CoA dehydrogenase